MQQILIQINKMNLPLQLYPKVEYKNTQILRFFLLCQTICLFPFFISDLALINNHYSPCLLANFNDGNYFGLFTLGQWVAMDGYIKLAVWSAILFFNAIEYQLNCKSILVVVSGNLIRFYYVFQFGWTVTCSCLFWGKNSGLPEKTYTYCKGSPFQGYIYFLLIFSYIIIPVNLYIGGARSKYDFVDENQLTISSGRRVTELIQKK